MWSRGDSRLEAVVTAANDSANIVKGVLQMTHYLPIRQPNDCVSGSYEPTIAGSVALELLWRAVILLSIHFYDQTIADKEVNAVTADPDLLSKPDSAPPQTELRQRFCS